LLDFNFTAKKPTSLHFTVKIVNFAPFQFYCEKSQLCLILQLKKSTLLGFTVKKVNFAPFYNEKSQLGLVLQ
jgi:hypothetical protein